MLGLGRHAHQAQILLPARPDTPSYTLVLPPSLPCGHPHVHFEVSYQTSILYWLWPQILEFNWTVSQSTPTYQQTCFPDIVYT